jgi:23S rRNA-/tRNA-specific pseudouridylate synthase
MPYITRNYTIGPNDSGRRLDRILRAVCADVPLSAIYRMFRDGDVRVAGKKIDGSYRTKAGDSLEIRLPDTGISDKPPSRPSAAGTDAASAFSRMILLETADIAVVNKPRGMLTHGDGGVDEAAKAYFSDRADLSLAFVPAPLHRLDRNTSGALAVSASLRGAVAFSAALRAGAVRKTYLALLGGDMASEETWIDELERDTNVGISVVGTSGKRAEAWAEPLLRSGGNGTDSPDSSPGRRPRVRARWRR